MVRSLTVALLHALTGGFVSACWAQDPVPSPPDPLPAETEVIVHPPFPRDVTPLGGATILPASEADYALHEVLQDGVRELWLSRRTSSRSSATARWRLVDTLRVPDLNDGEMLALAICGYAEEAIPEPEELEVEPEIIAIVPLLAGPAVVTEVRAAWRADRAGGRFRLISPEGIACLNEVPDL